MMRVRILSERCRLGHTGDVIDMAKHPNVNVRALVRGRHVEVVPPKKTASKKKTES